MVLAGMVVALTLYSGSPPSSFGGLQVSMISLLGFSSATHSDRKALRFLAPMVWTPLPTMVPGIISESTLMSSFVLAGSARSLQHDAQDCCSSLYTAGMRKGL